MIKKFAKPVLRAMLVLFALSFTIVACDNNKKSDKPAGSDTPKVEPAPAPTLPSAGDTLKTGDTGKPVVPDQ